MQVLLHCWTSVFYKSLFSPVYLLPYISSLFYDNVSKCIENNFEKKRHKKYKQFCARLQESLIMFLLFLSKMFESRCCICFLNAWILLWCFQALKKDLILNKLLEAKTKYVAFLLCWCVYVISSRHTFCLQIVLVL